MHNRISNRCMKIVVAVLCFSIIISCIFSEYRAFASFENGLADEQIDNVGPSKSHFFEGDGFSVEFNVTNEWNTGYIAQIKVVNTGNEKITNWKLSFPFDGEIRNIWDADLMQHLENNYIVSNCGYNRNINSGEYVEFGFEGIGELDSFPGEYTLINETSEVNPDDYSINYYVENDWGDGFTAGIVIRNNSEKTIENWKLSFKYDRTITNIWNAEIVSHEGNNYVIKNADYNADIMSNQEIFVGFCGIDGIYTDEIYDYYLKGSFITKNDSYNNIESSNSDSNESKENNNEALTNVHYDEIEIALHDLDILYQNNDSEISVTSNIGLLSEINGIPVSWLSSNVDIIDSNGNVNRPYDKSVFVELKAQLFYNSKLYTKSFSVRVIKSKYDNYCLDEIYTLDNLDQLFKYNAEPDDLDVFVKEDGRVNILVGRFSEIIVESPNEALLALNGMRKLIGMEKEDKLQYVDNYFDDEYITFNYIQLHNDIVVEGSYINITVDYDGNTIMLSNGIYTVEECISEIIDNETANQIAVNFDSKVDVIDGKLIYLIVDNYGKLTWVIKCRSENGQYHDMYIDAYSGMIVKNTQNATDNLTGSYQDEYGIFIDDVPTEVIKSEIRLVDPIRRLYILERNNISELWDSIFIDDALSYSSEGEKTYLWRRGVSVYSNFRKVYDYYKDNWGIQSISESNNDYIPIAINVKYDSMGESLEKNAAFIEDIQRFAIGNITTDDYGEISVGNELSIVAHEYTHGLIYKYNKNLRVGDYKKEAAAINEGYADVMGLLISDSQDWVIRYPGGEELRDGKESIDYSKLETTFNKDKYNSLNEDYGHKNGLVLSKACYLMLQYGMTKELLAKIVKNSLFRSYYPVNPTYFDVKEHFLTAAKIESGKDTHILSIIQKAFDGVGVEGDSRINAESIKNILNCRVVSADIAGIGVQTPLEDVKIVLESKTHSPIFSLSLKNGLYGFYTFSNSKIINPGDYYITYIKEGYQQLTRKIKIEDSQYIYLDAAEMIPSENTEFGTVNFYVVDSETKNGIKGLSVYIYDNNEKLVYSSVTNGVGKITIPDMQSGYYSVYVKDLREYDSVGGRENTYVATDRFFSIVKKDFLVDHYIAVTPKKYSGLMRIILEWNEYPEDLDSHLKGYRDYAITGDNPNDLIDRKLYDEEFHILYNSKNYTNRGEKIACLDHDEMDGYGPETVTIFKYNNDKYLYYIYQYSEAGDLKSSGAVVRVYLYENGLQDQYYVFSVPQIGDGRYWGVFCYYPDGNKDGDKIVPLNSISYYEPLG